MDLHERLSASREPTLAEPGRDSFSEVKNRIHFAVISGLGLLMMSLKLLRVMPGVPFASGYKTVVLFPLYILAAQLTYSRFGATTAGSIIGLVGLLNGDGRYGVFEVLRHIVPGLAINLLWPLFRRLPHANFEFRVLLANRFCGVFLDEQLGHRAVRFQVDLVIGDG